MQQAWPWVIVGLGLAGLVLMLGARADNGESRGPFEVRTHSSRYLSGWNEGRLQHRSVDYYSVRYRGRRVGFDGPLDDYSGKTTRYGRRLNAVLSFDAAPEVLVVNAGAGNNASYYFLLRVVEGETVAELLTKDRRGVVWAMLDQPRPAGKRQYTPRRQHYAQGSLLQLEDRSVVDLRDLSLYRYSDADDPAINHFAEPLGAAPDRRSALHLSYPHQGHYQLLVTDFVADELQRVPIDRARMRFSDWEQIDQAWVDHHFRWQPDPQGRLRLSERPDFQPLPHRGQMSTHTMGYPVYQLQPVRPTMLAAILALLGNRFDLIELPYDSASQQAALSGPGQACERQLRIGEEIIELRFSGYSIANLSLRARRESAWALLQQIASVIDAELQSGRLDQHYSTADLPWDYPD